MVNAVLAAGVMLLLTKDFESLIVVALSVIPGMVSGIMIGRKKDYYSTLLGVSVSFLVVLLGTLLLAGRGGGGLCQQQPPVHQRHHRAVGSDGGPVAHLHRPWAGISMDRRISDGS